MANVDNYETNITWQFKEELSSKEFNHLLAGILPEGIYKGGTLSVNSGSASKVDISPYIAWKDAKDDYSIAVKISTGKSITMSPTPTNNLIIAKYTWIDNVISNYPDYFVIPDGTQVDRDLVFGKVIFSGTSNIVSSFDYADRSKNPFEEMKYFDT